jgi:hypothetical protein
VQEIAKRLLSAALEKASEKKERRRVFMMICLSLFYYSGKGLSGGKTHQRR